MCRLPSLSWFLQLLTVRRVAIDRIAVSLCLHLFRKHWLYPRETKRANDCRIETRAQRSRPGRGFGDEPAAPVVPRRRARMPRGNHTAVVPVSSAAVERDSVMIHLVGFGTGKIITRRSLERLEILGDERLERHRGTAAELLDEVVGALEDPFWWSIATSLMCWMKKESPEELNSARSVSGSRIARSVPAKLWS